MSPNTSFTRVAKGCCASPVEKKPVRLMNGRPAAAALLGLMLKPRSLRLSPLVTVGFALMRLVDARATLIIVGFSIHVSDPMTFCSVAIEVFPAGEKFDPWSGLTLRV